MQMLLVNFLNCHVIIDFQSKTIAEQKAEKINAKLGYVPPVEEVEEVESKTILKRYEEELDINDFPQTARWKVTSKVFKLYRSIPVGFYMSGCIWLVV